MKKNNNIFLIPLLFVVLNTSAQQPESNSVKGQINIDFFTRLNLNGFYDNYYFINGSYRAVNNVDFGLYYGRDFSSFGKGNGHGNKSGISLNYSFNSLLFKGNDKFDLYTKVLTGIYWYDYTFTRTYFYEDHAEQDVTINYAGTEYDINCFVGAKYFPVKWFGFMTEFGYQKYYEHWIVNFGLCFRI